MRRRSIFTKIAVAVCSFVLALVASELAIRIALSGRGPLSARLRDPHRFANCLIDDDWWILEHAWRTQRWFCERKPHPLLGWVGNFSRDTYAHLQKDELNGRIPVLLYGDSFAQCLEEATSFQAFLNNDEEFSKTHYLLNYGVGGYGVDQIYLLFLNSIDHYEKPFVIFSFMTLDLDRSILTVRDGQKPYFVADGDDMRLAGVPIDPDIDRFYRMHPPYIRSYFWRLLFHSMEYGKQECISRRREKQTLDINRRILAATIRELRSRKLDFIFLVFQPIESFCGKPNWNWRDVWIMNFLDGENIPYICTKDVLDRKAPGRKMMDLFVHNNWHPTPFANRLIAEEIKRQVLTYKQHADVVSNHHPGS